MDSSGLKQINVILNSISGNCFPINLNEGRHSIAKRCYMAIAWTISSVFSVIVSVIVLFIPKVLAFQYNTLPISVSIEGITAIYISIRLPLLRRLVNKMQTILIENDTLKEALLETLGPISQPIRIYVIFSLVAPSFWTGLGWLKLLNDQDHFTYTDFRIPSYFPFEPFSRKVFAFAVLVQIIGSMYIVARKFSTDVYIIHLIALLTAQYRFLSNDLAQILEVDETKLKTIEEQREAEKNCKNRLNTWIKHHQDVIAISGMLKEITTLHVLVTFTNFTSCFCTLAIMIIKMTLIFVEKCILFMYGGVCLTELFVLCYCVQELTDSSITVTPKAFHSDWFMHNPSIQRTFSTIIAADNIRSRLSAFGMVDLSLATFTQIINHAYTACLFLLKAD